MSESDGEFREETLSILPCDSPSAQSKAVGESGLRSRDFEGVRGVSESLGAI